MTSTIKVNNLQNQCGANTINKCGTAITVGASGDTVTLAAGATQSGFGQTYSAVSWDTTPKTTTVTGVAGVGYFVNTTAGAITANLPAGTAGDVIAFADYAATWQTNNVTVAPNGTDKIGSLNENATLNTEGQSVTFVYVDATQGWINTMDSTSNVRGNPFMAASGGVETTCGNYKIHTFTGPSTFIVSKIASCAADNNLDYLVAAGGGGSDLSYGGGGGGGFRFFANTTNNPQTGPGSPRNNFPAGTTITATLTSYPITIGAGGTGATNPQPPDGNSTAGANSVFSTVTSTGGGRAGNYLLNSTTLNGGSGGGGGSFPGPGANPGGTGNTPPVSPPQGMNGGAGYHVSCDVGGGGGGAIIAGGNAASPYQGGTGGAGAGITGFGAGNGECSSCVQYFSGGGGGANPPNGAPGVGGIGGGGDGKSPSRAGTAGTANTGGGGGGKSPTPGSGNAGGSGIVVIRYKFQ